MYWYGLIIPILSFFLQVWPRLINRYFGVDSWRHLMIADYVRVNKHLPETMESKYILPAPFGYPPFIIMFLAFFPKKIAEKFQFVFSPLFDSFSNFLIFVSALVLTSDFKVAIIAQIIASLTPIIVIESSILNPRSLSYLLFYLSFFSLLMYSSNGSLIHLLGAAIIFVILLYTHKLAVQAYLLLVIAFSVAEKNPFYIVFFFTMSLLTIVFGGKSYKRILEDHLVTLENFREYYDFHLHQFKRQAKQDDKSDFIAKLYTISFKNPLGYILANNPWIAVLLILYILTAAELLNFSGKIPSLMFNKLNVWIFTLLILGFLILSIKKLKFLGEGNRYIEYLTLPISIVLGSYGSNLFNLWGLKFLIFFTAIILSLALGIIYLQFKAIVQDKQRTITADLWKVINFLRTIEKKKLRLFFSPTSLGDPVMYFVKGKALLTDCGKGVRRLREILPTLSISMNEVIKKYQINYILIDQIYVTLEELELKEYKSIKEFGSYLLIEV